MGRKKRTGARAVRRNPISGRQIGYALLGLGAYILLKKSGSLGEERARDVRRDFYEEQIQKAIQKAPDEMTQSMLTAAYGIKPGDPEWMMGMKLSNVRAVVGIQPDPRGFDTEMATYTPPWSYEKYGAGPKPDPGQFDPNTGEVDFARGTVFGEQVVFPIGQKTEPSTSEEAMRDRQERFRVDTDRMMAERSGLTPASQATSPIITDPGQFDPNTGEVDFARGTVFGEQVVSPIAPAPKDVRAIGRSVGPIGPGGTGTRPEPGQFSPVTGEVINQAVGAVREPLSTSLMTADVSKAIISQRPVDVSQMVIAARAPDPSQVDPDMSRRMREEQRDKVAVDELNRSLVSTYENALNKGAITDDFMRALKAKTGSYLPIQAVGGITSIQPGAEQVAISSAFYAKVDASGGDPALQKRQTELANAVSSMKKTGDPNLGQAMAELSAINRKLASQEGKSLREYQDAFSKKVQLEEQLKNLNPGDSQAARLGDQLKRVNEKVAALDAQAKMAYNQAVDIKQLEAKHVDERRELAQLAKDRGYVSPGGSMIDLSNPDGISDPNLRKAALDLKLRHSVEDQRLKERHMGMGEGRGRGNISESAARARAESGKEKQQREAAREVRVSRDAAEEAIKKAMAKGEYTPAPGESFDDAVKKEMATGAHGSKSAEMQAAARKRLKDMAEQAAGEREKARLLPPLPLPTPAPAPPPASVGMRVPGATPVIYISRKAPSTGGPASSGGDDYGDTSYSGDPSTSVSTPAARSAPIASAPLPVPGASEDAQGLIDKPPPTRSAEERAAAVERDRLASETE